MEKQLTKEEMERKVKTQLKMLELQAQVYDEKINKIRNEIHDLEKQNKKITKENNENVDKTKIDVNNEKINKLKKKLRELKKEKEQKLGGNFTDDTTVRPFIDIE